MLTTALELSCAICYLDCYEIYVDFPPRRYLIEGSKGAVLHTGDMRSEACHIDSLRKNPFLSRYLAPNSELDYRGFHGESSTSSEMFPALEAIYLDTACLVGTADVPAKVCSTRIPAAAVLMFIVRTMQPLASSA